MCIRVLPESMSEQHVCVWCQDSSDEYVPPVIGITNGFDLPCVFWEPNLGLLEEQQAVLTTESFFQTQKTILALF